MAIKSYLSEILFDQSTNINEKFIFVIIPILSMVILMFGLRALLTDHSPTELQK